MFQVGDLLMYSPHGVCQVDDITEKNFAGATRTYYVLHPIEDPDLIINIPTDHKHENVFSLINKEDSETMIDSFREPGMEWITSSNQRLIVYQNIINKGNREQISQVINTLMRKEDDAESNGKKLGQADQRILNSAQKTLFTEMAITLNTTVEAIEERVNDNVKLQE